MRYFFIFIFILSGITTYSQFTVTIQWQPVSASAAGDTMYYDAGKKLTWNDFRGTPDHKSIAAAITASGFGYTMAMNGRGNKTNVVITVYCFFNKSNSWVKRGMKNDYGLLHEQHHFDITYLLASRFIQRLKGAAFTRNNYEALLEKINNDTYAELEKMQNDYDGQTKNGQLKDVQGEWNEKVDKLLALAITN